jgi:hypothetical protein
VGGAEMGAVDFGIDVGWGTYSPNRCFPPFASPPQRAEIALLSCPVFQNKAPPFEVHAFCESAGFWMEL